MHLKPTVCTLALLLSCAACVTDGDASSSAVSAAGERTEAAAEFAMMEERLLALDMLYVDFAITSEGAVSSDLTGTLVLQSGQVARLVAGGRFDGREVALKLVSDGQAFNGGSEAGRFGVPTPRALHEGLLLGMTRMGLLHNLARLSAGQEPDATDGTVRLWVKPTDVRKGGPETEDGRQLVPFRFGISVNGQQTGKATLWVDTETMLPVRREQTVEFPQGEMRVVERYPLLELEGPGPLGG